MSDGPAETGTAGAATVPVEAVASRAAIEQENAIVPAQDGDETAATQRATPATLEQSRTISESTVVSSEVAAVDEVEQKTSDATAQPSVSSPDPVEPPATTDEPISLHTAADEDDADFVPPDMEHIVTTGAAEDGASSMQALRELVAQARASSGQPREALPPGFGDDDTEASTSTPSRSQRGEKRKAEVELEELVQSSAGIDEVKLAAEKSQHPETKTLLQKALSSISGLVSRRAKADPFAEASSTLAISGQSDEQADIKPLVDVEQADASDESDSSSDSCSSSGDSSDDEDDEDEDEAENADMVLVNDDEDEEGGGTSAAPVTKNEILAPEVEQPAIQEVTAEEKQTLRKLGKVHSIVDSVVVVEQDVQQSQQADAAPANAAPAPVDSTGRQGERQGEYSVLDTGSLLCFEDGKVLGLVFETFGSIHNPMYSIRFASAAAIDRDLISAGKAVFYLPKQSTYVLTQLLRSMKGSDASNMWDEEVAEDEIDYSDDEQEADAKRRAKAIRSGKVDDQGNPLPAPSARGNKRQRQQDAAQGSQPPSRHSANGSFHQRSGPQSTQQRPFGNAPSSLPKRNVGDSSLPLPPNPAGPSSLAPAFPHGVSSLPPRPSAGLPSKPSFSSEASTDTSAARPRSRTGTAEGALGGLTHSRLSSASASGLPPKPVDAVAAAAATAAATSASASSKTSSTASSPYRAPAGVVDTSPPPHAPRGASMRFVPPGPAGAYPHQGSSGHYAGATSAPSSLPASPAAPSRNASAHGSTYSSGSAAPVPVQGGGHYNPAYAGHWQQSYGPSAASAPHAHPAAGGHAWTRQQAYQPPPLHMAPGVMSQQPYGGYGSAYGGYGAPSGASGAAWTGQAYPGSHYPGYADRQYHASAANAAAGAGHASQHAYAPPAPSYAHAGFSNQSANTDPYNGYTYTPPSAQQAPTAGTAAITAASDSYDPRGPLMGGSSNGQTQPPDASG